MDGPRESAWAATKRQCRRKITVAPLIARRGAESTCTGLVSLRGCHRHALTGTPETGVCDSFQASTEARQSENEHETSVETRAETHPFGLTKAVNNRTSTESP